MKACDLAPCGINCALCYAYQRTKNTCPGCNGTENKPVYCTTCSVRQCEKKKDARAFCGLCDSFPCKRLKSLNKRYSDKYGVNLFENLRVIHECGTERFLRGEKIKWKCAKCGGILCMHKATCPECGEVNPHYGATNGGKK